MKVGELKELLSHHDDEMEVILTNYAKDYEVDELWPQENKLKISIGNPK